MNDEAIVQEIKNTRCTKHFGMLYDKYAKLIYNKCYTFVNNEDEAKDLTQDIFLKLFVKLDSFKGNSKFSTWLYSFTYNHCINHVTRNKKRKYEQRYSQFYDYEYIEDEKDNSAYGKDEYLGEKLNYALEKISPKERSILILKYQENLSIKQLESKLGIKNSAVKMRVKRARERFALHYDTCPNRNILRKVS